MTTINLYPLTIDELHDLKLLVNSEIERRNGTKCVRICWKQPHASGHRTGWARSFTSIDKSIRGAKAFIGEYLKCGYEIDLKIGSYIIEVYPTGSVKHSCDHVKLLRVSETGELKQVGDSYEWREQYLSFVDMCIREIGYLYNAK